MRRDPDTPNGLTEFLVAEAVGMLRERGVEEISLNFATAARFMHSPSNRFERLSASSPSSCNRFFQIESLYRFNAKFFPRWEPRYAVYEGRLGLPRMVVAAMWAEGQLPKPQLARRLPGGGRRRSPDAPTPAPDRLTPPPEDRRDAGRPRLGSPRPTPRAPGSLMLAVNLVCAGIGAGIGRAGRGGRAVRLLVGFAVGFGLANPCRSSGAFGALVSVKA